MHTTQRDKPEPTSDLGLSVLLTPQALKTQVCKRRSKVPSEVLRGRAKACVLEARVGGVKKTGQRPPPKH